MGASNCPDLALPKGKPGVVLREERRQSREGAADAFRAEVWRLDEGRDRATGKPVFRCSPDPDRHGEVAHLKGRRVRPEWLTDPKRAILLSRTNHKLHHAAGRGGTLLEIIGTDARKPLTFIRRDWDGKVLWRRISMPSSARLTR